MVGGDRLVEAESFLVIKGARFRFVGIDVINGGLRAVVRRRLIEGDGVARGAIGLDGARLDGPRRQAVERLGERGHRARQRGLVLLEKLVGGLLELILSLIERLPEGIDVRRALRPGDRELLRLDLLQLLRSQLVELLRREPAAGAVPDEARITGIPARPPPAPHLAPTPWS